MLCQSYNLSVIHHNYAGKDDFMPDTALYKAQRKIRQLFPEKKSEQSLNLYLKLVGTFFAAFLFSSSKIPVGFSPFGISFCVAVPAELHFAALPGAVLGYWLSLSAPMSIRYCAGAILCSVISCTFRKYLPSLQKSHLISLYTPLSLLICGGIYLTASEAVISDVFLLIAEAVAGYIFTLILLRLFSLPSDLPEGLSHNKDTIYLSAVLCVFLLCGSGLTLKDLSPVRALCFSVILFFASFKGISAGSISGICIGFSLSLLPGFGRLFPVMAAGGFAAGLLSGYGQAVSSVLFFICTLAVSLFYSVDRIFLTVAAEAFIGSLIFALAPASFILQIQDCLKKKGLIKDRVSDTAASQGLRTAAHNIYQVCDIITQVSDTLENQNSDNTAEDPFYKMKLYEMRRLLTDQFLCVGDFLNEFANEINGGRIHDPSRSAALKNTLREGGVYVDSLRYFTDKNGAVTVEVLLIDRPFDINWKKAQSIISIVTSRRFERPEISVNEASTMLTFRQRLPFRLQLGYSQKSARDGAVCGDSVSLAARTECKGFALISDGMGTGERAAVDSRMTAGIMKKLICSGFSFDSAIKIINSALIVRGDEESLATVDGVEINLFTGKTVFYKAGASASLVRKDDRIASLEKASLPLGILRNTGFSKSTFTAEPGDIILLLSDGVTAGDWSWIHDELLSWSTNNMEDLSMHILKLAHLRQEKATADDMTVVAIKLERNGR